MNKYFVMLSLVLSSCGHNNGTPAYSPSNDGNATPKPKIEGLDLAQTVLSKDGHWRVKITWMNGPQFSEVQPIENKMQLFFIAPGGGAVDTLKDVTVVPFMPQHGHGLGNKKPLVAMGDLGVADVSGLWFPMVGDWQFTVNGTVDGLYDTAVFHADVTQK